MVLFYIGFEHLKVPIPILFAGHTFKMSSSVSQRETRFARHSRAVLCAPCSLWRQPESAKGLFLKYIFLPQPSYCPSLHSSITVPDFSQPVLYQRPSSKLKPTACGDSIELLSARPSTFFLSHLLLKVGYSISLSVLLSTSITCCRFCPPSQKTFKQCSHKFSISFLSTKGRSNLMTSHFTFS